MEKGKDRGSNWLRLLFFEEIKPIQSVVQVFK